MTENFDIVKITKEAIDERVKEIANEEFEEAVKRIESRRDEVVTGTVLRIQKFVSYEHLGNVLRIEIKEKTN